VTVPIALAFGLVGVAVGTYLKLQGRKSGATP
jgi:hypothetical protein